MTSSDVQVAPEQLMARIRRLSSQLSAGQQKVVEFFVNRCDRAVFLTSLQVGAVARLVKGGGARTR